MINDRVDMLLQQLRVLLANATVGMEGAAGLAEGTGVMTEDDRWRLVGKHLQATAPDVFSQVCAIVSVALGDGAVADAESMNKSYFIT